MASEECREGGAIVRLEDVAPRFQRVQWRGSDSFQALCPCHKDKEASLSISNGHEREKIVLHCHAGCETADILEAVGLTLADLGEGKREDQPSWMQGLDAIYDYRDKEGKYLYSKLRYTGKKIRYGRIEGDSLVNGKGDAGKSLYRLPEALRAVENGQTIYIPEGEKDVNTLRDMGFAATTVGGVSDWKKEYSQFLKGAVVVLLPDNDEPGKKLMERIAKDIQGVCARYKVVTTSQADKGDVTDYVNEGHSKEDFQKLVEAEPWIVDGVQNKERGKLKLLKNVEDTEVRWLWEPFIQAGNLTLLRGDGGVGKTFLVAAIASAVSRDVIPFNMPGTLKGSGAVIYFGSEDDPADFKRRVKASDGDLGKIAVMDEPFSMADVEGLEYYIKEMDASLVIFDPVQAFLGEKVNMDKSNQVRPIMDGLRRVSRETGCAVLIIEHLNKATNQSILYRGSGSQDFFNSVRGAFVVSFHPEIENYRVLVQIKTNSKAAPSAAFEIRSLDGSQAAFEWRGVTDVTKDDLEQRIVATGTIKAEGEDPVIEYVEALMKEHAEGWTGFSSDIMLEGSELSGVNVLDPTGIGMRMNRPAVINTLRQKGIKVSFSQYGKRKKYQIYKVDAEEPQTLQEESNGL